MQKLFYYFKLANYTLTARRAKKDLLESTKKLEAFQKDYPESYLGVLARSINYVAPPDGPDLSPEARNHDLKRFHETAGTICDLEANCLKHKIILCASTEWIKTLRKNPRFTALNLDESYVKQYRQNRKTELYTQYGVSLG